MTALLEFKQRLKNLYGKYENYLQPVLKFFLAMAYFFWINSSIGFSDKLKSPFVLLILALVCSILPTNMIVWIGFALIIGHCYSLGAVVAAFAAVLILLLMILFLRFSTKSNILLALTPLGCFLKIPAIIPIGGGLLSTPTAAFSGGCSVIIYYFLNFLKEQSAVLQNEETEVIQKIKLLADGLMKNQEMWFMTMAFVAVILLVNLIRTRSLDYAWRIAIVVGGVTYVLVLLAGGLFLNVKINIVSVSIFAGLAVLAGLVLEFFAFGGDYTRTERLEFEDDEYFYYVKAVPKVSISTSERNIKKINGDSQRDARQGSDAEVVVEYSNPLFEDASWRKKEPKKVGSQEQGEIPEIAKPKIDEIDFEKKLEESLKDL